MFYDIIAQITPVHMLLSNIIDLHACTDSALLQLLYSCPCRQQNSRSSGGWYAPDSNQESDFDDAYDFSAPTTDAGASASKGDDFEEFEMPAYDNMKQDQWDDLQFNNDSRSGSESQLDQWEPYNDSAQTAEPAAPTDWRAMGRAVRQEASEQEGFGTDSKGKAGSSPKLVYKRASKNPASASRNS